MLRRALVIVTLATLGLTSVGGAQDARDLSVKTFRLKNLKPEDAAKLLGPYVNSPGGGVFEAGAIGAITVRETPTILGLVDSLLRTHDRARAVVSMRFQLIAALDTVYRDPAIASIDAELRKLFKFQGYEMIGEGTMLTEELNDFMTTFSSKARIVGNQKFNEAFRIRGWMDGVSGVGNERSIRLTVALQDAGDNDLLRTGLTVPIGQTVILGSARPTMVVGLRGALILVVQPEIATR